MTIKVTIEDKEYGLTFGMIAVEEMQLRTIHNMQSGIAGVGNWKALTDMFFCSHNNYSDLNGTPRINYAEAAEIVEQLVYSNDTVTQNLIVETFQNCKATKTLMAKFEKPEAKKKVTKKKSQTTTK